MGDPGEGGAGDGRGGESVLFPYGPEFLDAVAEEAAVQLEQQRVRCWREEGLDECALGGASHSGAAQEAGVGY